MVLEKINKVNDIKQLTDEEIVILAKELRDLMIKTTSENGGHIASSLGVVELTIALLSVLDLEKDKIIWDVGHQTYAYKILTGRKDRFPTIRKFKGLSGFPKTNESKYDAFNTGHSSTSISVGLGMTYANILDNKNETIVSVIGDGSLTGGMAFEALNNLSKLNKNFIIILNDNEMSISESDGGIKHALMGLRTSYRYTKLKNIIKKILKRIPFGNSIKYFIININKALKQIFVSSGMLFENLDIVYLGPIDGHNINLLKETITKAKKLDKACLIHTKTKKGKGYKFAEENPSKFHGIAPFDIDTGELKNKSNKKTWTKIFSDKIVEKSDTNNNIVCITAAMTDGVGLADFKEKYSNRLFDVGICEQHAVTFAAGLSSKGKIPIVCIYSSFLQRAFDQILHDVCLNKLHVVFMIDRAGIVGADGETHQGIFDIAYLKMLPNMTIMSPKNDKEFIQMIDFAIDKLEGPVAIRYNRGDAVTEFSEYNNNIELGKAEIIEKGKDIVLYALGQMLVIADKVKNELKKYNISPTLVNARFVNPIDCKLIDNLLNEDHKLFITFEEGVKYGSMGESISTYVCDHFNNVKTDIIALPNKFIEHGTREELLNMLNLSIEDIVKKILVKYGSIKN